MPTARILVVEDEQITAAVLRKRLQAFGYEVPATVSSGEEAVEKTGELRPDLVLMDIQLDGPMDGMEAAAQIRQRFQTPIVFLTAYSNREIQERAKLLEPDGYILKPFEDRELQAVVEAALARLRAERGRHEPGK
jgi:CheY-like chemotaxis protein